LTNSSRLGVSPNKGKNKAKGESPTSDDHDVNNNFSAEVKVEETIDVF
jgi:hypothetical protein